MAAQGPSPDFNPEKQKREVSTLKALQKSKMNEAHIASEIHAAKL